MVINQIVGLFESVIPSGIDLYSCLNSLHKFCTLYEVTYVGKSPKLFINGEQQDSSLRTKCALKTQSETNLETNQQTL